jgi:cytochrome c553
VVVKRLSLGAWLTLVALLPLSASADDARGQELFQLCSQCHGVDGGGSPLALAPSIAGLSEWYVEAQLHKFRDGVRAAHFDDLAGLRMRPMARWLKTDDDVKSVSAYVASLPKVRPAATLGGDAARGQTLYATCAACHGADGAGNQAMNSPALSHTSDWYLLTQIKNFKQGIRGGSPKDTTGIVMRPMSMMLTDEQAMKDVIAYIGTLGQ